MNLINHVLDKPRFEFKFVHEMTVINEFIKNIKNVMMEDPQYKGGYQVNSLYYDTDDFSAYYEKIDGVDPRYKLRLRFYGDLTQDMNFSAPAIFFESKHRNNQTLHKNRVRLDKSILTVACRQIPLTVNLDDYTEDLSIQTKILNRCILQRPILPMCLVSYYRQPFVCDEFPQLRVTVDTNLRVLHASTDFRGATENGQLFLPDNLAVLEIKFHYAMPLWIQSICRKLHLYSRRYSKYASALEKLFPEELERSISYQSIFLL